MTTWHQDRRPVRIGDITQWTVYDNPPGGFASGMLQSTEQAARAYMKEVQDQGNGRHLSLIPPLGFKALPVREPARGRKRATYQAALDKLYAAAEHFAGFNPAHARFLFIRVRFYSRASGYACQLLYSDSNSGGSVPVALEFSGSAV